MNTLSGRLILFFGSVIFLGLVSCKCYHGNPFRREKCNLVAKPVSWFAPAADGAWFVYRIKPFGYVDTFYVRGFTRGVAGDSEFCEDSEYITYQLVAAHPLDSLRKMLDSPAGFFNGDSITVGISAHSGGHYSSRSHSVSYSGKYGADYVANSIEFDVNEDDKGDWYYYRRNDGSSLRMEVQDTVTHYGQIFREVIRAPYLSDYAIGYFQKDIGLVGAEFWDHKTANRHSMVLLDYKR